MILTLRGIRGKEFKIHGDVPHKAVGSHQQSEISTKSFDDNRSCPGTWACQGVGQGGLLANHCQTCLPSEAGTGRKLLTVTDHAVKKQEPEPKHIQIPRVHISRRITFLGGKKKKTYKKLEICNDRITTQKFGLYRSLPDFWPFERERPCAQTRDNSRPDSHGIAD